MRQRRAFNACFRHRSELIGAGHRVLGLTRSDAGAKSLAMAGAQAHLGDLEDLESLRTGAANSDAVIHTAFIHDFSKFKENCEIDRRAIAALGSVLEGSHMPLIVTSATGLSPAVAARGVPMVVVRLPQVHDTVKQGLITYAIAIAREKGVSAYVGDGRNRCPAAHRLDVALLYRPALDRATPGARYHAVAEEGVPVKEIAEAVARGLHVPVVSLAQEDAPAHFGWLAPFAAWDLPACSAQTRQKLGWNPPDPASSPISGTCAVLNFERLKS